MPSFLDADAQARAASLRDTDAYRSLAGDNDAALEVERTRHMQGVMSPLSIERLVDHIEHIAELVGIEHVGIGSDFDGITTTVEGLEDVSCYGNLREPLLRRGFSEEDVARVFGGNMERVLLAVIPKG